jgi:hypothetical protein
MLILAERFRAVAGAFTGVLFLCNKRKAQTGMQNDRLRLALSVYLRIAALKIVWGRATADSMKKKT